MSQDSPKDRLDHARRHLLGSPYGRFDPIPGIVPVRELLQGKPRQVARLIAQRLDVPLEQVNTRALTSWMLRFKKRHEAARSKGTGQKGDGEGDEGKGKGGDWMDFKPSEPKRQEPQEGDLLGFPDYD
jgi:hypothetical protein